mgnify:CR=1 FL=1
MLSISLRYQTFTNLRNDVFKFFNPVKKLIAAIIVSISVIGVIKGVVQVLAIGKRAEYEVFKDASKRLEGLAIQAINGVQATSVINNRYSQGFK